MRQARRGRAGLLAGCVLVWTTGLAARQVALAPPAEEPCRLINPVGPTIVELRGRGSGADFAEAITQARSACLDWFVLNYLISSKAEADAFQAQHQELVRALDRIVSVPDPKQVAVGSAGAIAILASSPGRVSLEATLRLDRAVLEREFEARRIRTEPGRTARAGWTLAVRPSHAHDPEIDQAVGAGLLQHLLARGWEVVEPAASPALRLPPNIDPEIAHRFRLAGSAPGADVVVEFEAIVESRLQQTALALRAEGMDFSSDAIVAAATFAGQSFPSSSPAERQQAIDRAVASVGFQIDLQLEAHGWEVLHNGRHIRVVTQDAGKGVELWLNDVLRAPCLWRKLDTPKDGMVSMEAACRDPEAVIKLLRESVSQKWPDRHVEVFTLRRSLVLLVFE